MSAEVEATALHTQGLGRATLRERMLSPWPRINWQLIVMIIGVVLAYRWGLEGTQVDAGEFIEGLPSIWNFPCPASGTSWCA